jgi:hypothetical protein
MESLPRLSGGRAYINCLAGNFSERASLQGWRVTRRKNRLGAWYFSQKAVTVQGGYGALFAVQVQV